MTSFHKLLFFFPLLLLVATGLKAQAELYDPDRITEVELTMMDDAWEKKLTAYKDANVKKRVLGSIKINGIAFDSVGVRFKGNSSYFNTRLSGTPKLPLNIKLSYTHKKQAYDGRYRTLKLSNVFRDPSFIREPLSYEIARAYVPAPKANYARVTVNGDYWGLYVLTQSIDEEFQREHYGSRKGVLFKCDPDRKVDKGTACQDGEIASLEYLGPDRACYQDRYEIKRSKASYDELIELIRLLNTDIDKFSEIFNVDEALWMHAYNNVLVNLDSYTGLFCHNYYLYQDTAKIWHPLLWDMNMSIGGFRFTGIKGNPKLSNEQMGEMSIFMHLRDRTPNRPLITELLGIPLYRKMYVAHVKTIYEEFIKEDQYKVLADKYREQIGKLVAEDAGKLYSTEAFEKNYTESIVVEDDFEVVGITELFDARKKYFNNHPLITAAAPEIVSHRIEQGLDGVKAIVEIKEADLETRLWLMYRNRPFGPWIRQQLSPQDPAAHQYIATLESNVHSYYLVAEGNLAATVLPARSAKEWFEVMPG